MSLGLSQFGSAFHVDDGHMHFPSLPRPRAFVSKHVANGPHGFRTSLTRTVENDKDGFGVAPAAFYVEDATGDHNALALSGTLKLPTC